jgi:NADPH:quinone reductase-like Zn-dependent oxidoreductase
LEEIGLKEAETVLIAGAAGGGGTIAVQLATSLRARVLGTASPHRHGYLRSLDAAEAIDYNEDLIAAVRNMALDGVDADEARLREDRRGLPAVRQRPGRLSPEGSLA